MPSTPCGERSLATDAGDGAPAQPSAAGAPAASWRALGIDLGTRRIGVALCDSAGTVATPYEVVVRSGDEARDHRQLHRLATEAEVVVVVVGLPLSLDGSEGPAARRAQEEADRLAKVVGVPVERFDERLTTVSAERDLRAGGLRGPARRQVVDKVAAAVMLQSWLDARRRRGRDPLR